MTMRAVRGLKVVLVALVALWGIVGVWYNLEDSEGSLRAIAIAAGMEQTAEGSGQWRAVHSPAAVWAGFAAIVLGKLLAAVLCTIGAWRLWRVRALPVAEFQAAKAPAILGCGIAVAMLFGVFIVIGDGHFLLWQTGLGTGNVLPSALRYLASIGVILLFLVAPDPD